MRRRIVVIGAGMGGLAAGLRLVQAGHDVTLVEARELPGGLAGGLQREGLEFDAGPYILLDRLGLEWAFRSLGLELTEQVTLRPLEQVYEVSDGTGEPVLIHSDLEETAAGLERRWPGSGERYRRFVQRMAETHRLLEPLLHMEHRRTHLLHAGRWRALPILARPLRDVLRSTGLPHPVLQALAIWTHVAGQKPEEAPAPLAFVPALIHTVGCYYPAQGIGAIPQALADAFVRSGGDLRLGQPVRRIRVEGGRATGVELDGEWLPADAVVSNAPGVGTYLELLEQAPPAAREKLERLPLQSPGVCAYLAVRGPAHGPYLRFSVPPGELCRLLVRPAVPVPELLQDGWSPARLIAPMRHSEAEAGGEAGQAAFLERILAEEWWRSGFSEVRILERRIPAGWGAEYHLHRQSMNPVMTAAFMRAGRLPHRSPWVRNLYLAGSATHPGQWVSFCTISGVLAADCVRKDLE